MGDLIRKCRAELRKLLPAAFELVYDDYNFFVIGYCSTAKPSTCIVSRQPRPTASVCPSIREPRSRYPSTSCRAKANRTALSSYRRLRPCAPRRTAIVPRSNRQAKVPLVVAGTGVTVIQSVSAKQRLCRKTRSDI